MRHSLTIFFTLLGSLTYAQNPENIIVQKYTQKDGINSYNIRRVAADRYGFIWVATQDGLERFDGKNFTSYTRNSPPGHRICGVDIRELIPDDQGLLWVLPGEVGINAINPLTGNVVKTIPIPPSGNEDWNICMLKAGNYLWVGTFTGLKLYNIAAARFEAALIPPGDPANSVEFEVRSILRDQNGNIWVAYTGLGIVIYSGETRTILRVVPLSALNDHLGSHAIRFLKGVEANPGTVLYATNQGLRQIGYDRFYTLTIDNLPCKTFPALNTEPLEYLALVSDQLLVAGYGGLLKFDRSLQRYTVLRESTGATDSKWLNAVQCIYADHDNNLWLGCQEGLAFIAGQKSPFDPYVYDETSKIKLDHVRYVYPLQNGDILAGLRNGIVHIDHTTRAFTLYDKEHVYNHIFQDKEGRLIVSRPDGLFTFDHGKTAPLSLVYPEFAQWNGVYINSHIRISDSLIVLGTESNSGILLWDPLHHRVRQIGKETGANLLSSNIVDNIYRDSHGRLWVLSDNVISILSPGLSSSIQLTLPHKLFFDMCEARGIYWVASYGSGLIQLDSNLRIVRVVSTGSGLANDGVYQLYNLGDKQLLVTTNNGISLVNLDAFSCRNYTAGDGLHSNGFEEVCGTIKGGLIYAGGLNGFTVIDPVLFTTNTKPPAFYFTGVHTQLRDRNLDTGDLHLSNLSIPSAWLQTGVSFIGLNFSSPGSVHYQYRIPEQDTTWLNLGAQTMLNFIGLAPGRYTLEAKAANEDGYWSKPTRLTLVFQAKWYETSWFKLALILAIAALLYGLYLFRITEWKKQQQIRSGIASDLHDDIGSLLNSVKLFSHLAKKEPAHEEHFNNIDDSLTQATTGLRDMIWVLDNSEDTISELMDRIKKYALPVTGAAGIAFDCRTQLPEKTPAISKAEKRNLLLIAKEAINNSVKYSVCRTISVQCTAGKQTVELIISDDGQGFDATAPGFGNGLRNMKERARQIRYRCKIATARGQGTRILVAKH